MWIHCHYTDDKSLPPFYKWGLKSTEIEWLGEGTLVVEQSWDIMLGSALFQFRGTCFSKELSLSLRMDIGADSKHPRSYSYINSYWPAIHKHLHGYVVLDLVITVHGSCVPESNPTEKLVKRGDSGIGSFASEWSFLTRPVSAAWFTAYFQLGSAPYLFLPLNTPASLCSLSNKVWLWA